MTGDRWVFCAAGHQHWGAYGAAGLFLVADGHVLLQHRVMWSHHGGTWGIPGGALASDETAAVGALREAIEEAHIDTSAVDLLAEIVDDHGRWAYTTVIARTSHQLAVRPGPESITVEWVPLDEVASFDLHPGFAKTLPTVLARVAAA
jgi:ADP-ribose pyrophosphatase YjhB (NUDIX family)